MSSAQEIEIRWRKFAEDIAELGEEHRRLGDKWHRKIFPIKRSELIHTLLRGSFFLVPGIGLVLESQFGNFGNGWFAASGAMMILIGVMLNMVLAIDADLVNSIFHVSAEYDNKIATALEFRSRSSTIAVMGPINNDLEEMYLFSGSGNRTHIREVRSKDGAFYRHIEIWSVVIGTAIWAFGGFLSRWIGLVL